MCIRQERSSVPWHDDPAMAGGGAIMEIGVHLFDTVHYVTGRRIVRVHAEIRDTIGGRVESVGSGLLWLEGGLVVGFDCAKCVDGRLTRL
jgi:predicted dehydrogenase